MLDDARIGVGQDHRPAGLALHLLSLGAELVPLVADVGADLARASEPEALLHAALGLHLGHFRRSSVVVIDKAPAGQPFWPGRDAPSDRKSGVSGKSESVRVDPGCRRVIKK